MTEQDKKSLSTRPIKQVSSKQLAKLVMVPILMFGFGFALVPLYDVFCAVTGLNGKTGRVEAADIQQADIDLSRTIKVRFLAKTHTGLPWSFEPMVTQMEVHPGKVYEAMYRVSSRTRHDTVGQAVPSVAPPQASLHFNKTECFCFTEQELASGETREMPLRFVIGHEIPKNIKEVTLSYTFFDIRNKQG